MNILNVPHQGMNKSQAAQTLGIKSYDVALPQPWLDEVACKLSLISVKDNDNIYDILLSSIVWSYDNGSFTGYPHPLTVKAFAYLKKYDLQYGTHYTDELRQQFNVLSVD